jgi:hypothetical protein
MLEAAELAYRLEAGGAVLLKTNDQKGGIEAPLKKAAAQTDLNFANG